MVAGGRATHHPRHGHRYQNDDDRSADELGRADLPADAMNRLNSMLQHVYSSMYLPTANVAQAFQIGATNLVTTMFGVVPENVAEICAATWICTAPPFGPNDHPNNAGYWIIAHAIYAQLPRLSSGRVLLVPGPRTTLQPRIASGA